jgi:hypothetical protein
MAAGSLVRAIASHPSTWKMAASFLEKAGEPAAKMYFSFITVLDNAIVLPWSIPAGG